MPDLPRDELIDMIAYALWHNRKLRPKRPDVVAHLELCMVETTRRPPAPSHSAGGGPERGGAAGEG